ncbi:MAG: PAS domain S-box protein [Flavobacteriia bacterium]|nr:PAS domain S-box protein [Flavobacteriia bacterium]
MFERFAIFKVAEKQFFNYYEKENDFHRLAIFYSIGALIVAPIFCLLAYNSEIPSIYFNICLSFTIAFPIYIIICWWFVQLRNYLIYFFIIHLFVSTYFAFEDLVYSNFDLINFIYFFVLFTICSHIIQRLIPTLIYIAYCIGLLIYGFNYVDQPELTKENVIIIFSIFSIATILVLLSRIRLINNVQDYSDYLKKIVNKPGSGFILFKLRNSNEDIIDFNQKTNNLFEIDNNDEKKRHQMFFSFFSLDEKLTIQNQTIDDTFYKRVELNHANSIRTLELKIVLLVLKSGKYWLCRLEDITENVSKQLELTNREKKYRDLYYKNQAGVFTLNKYSVLLDCNEAFLKIFENEFSINEPFFRAKDIESWNRLLIYLEEHETLRNEKFEIKLNSGKAKTLIFNWYIDRINSYIEGTVIDITKVENASKAIQLSEEKFRLIYEESNDAIFLLKDFRIIDTNRKGIQIFGFSRNELLNTDLYDLSNNPSDDKKESFEHILNELNHSKNIRFNWTFKGYSHIIEAEISIVELKVEKEILYQCVIRDVTEKNKNIRALETSQQNYKSILENTPEGFLIVKNDKVIFANPEIFRLCNVYDKEKLDIFQLFHNSDQERFNEIYQEHIFSKSIQEKQLSIQHSNELITNVDVTLVKTTFGGDDATLLIIKDVSVQNKLSKEILRAEIAEETNKILKEEISERIKTEKLLQDQYLRSKAIFDSSSNTLLFIFDMNHKISSFNKHSENYFYQLTGKKLEENQLYGVVFLELFKPKQLRYFQHLLNHVKKGKSERIEIKFINNDTKHWLELFINPIFDTEGKVYEISMVAHDITEKKRNEKEIVASLQEKEILLKEIHHRVKNNLQIISSILNLQSSFVQDQKILDILQDSRNRIRSMAMIHESLYRTTNFSSINFSNYIYNISSNLLATYRINEENINFKSNLNSVDLILDQAIPCGLMVNELITNAIKYAFPNNLKGEIKISLEEKENTVYLRVEDDGIGLPKDFDIENLESLGLQLVVSLTEQLNGNIEILKEKGTKFLITFEKAKQ